METRESEMQQDASATRRGFVKAVGVAALGASSNPRAVTLMRERNVPPFVPAASATAGLPGIQRAEASPAVTGLSWRFGEKVETAKGGESPWTVSSIGKTFTERRSLTR